MTEPPIPLYLVDAPPHPPVCLILFPPIPSYLLVAEHPLKDSLNKKLLKEIEEVEFSNPNPVIVNAAMSDFRTYTRTVSFILEWIEFYGTWDEFYWRPDILGSRLASWTANFAFFSSTANQFFLNNVLIELGRQSRHLSRTVLQGLPGYPIISEGLLPEIHAPRVRRRR